MKELSDEELSIYQKFGMLTGVFPKMFFIDNGGALFIVEKKDLFKVIGRFGNKIPFLEKKLGFDKVYVAAYDSNPERFTKNLFSNVSHLRVEYREAYSDKAVFLYVKAREKNKVLGKNKIKFKLASQAVEELFGSKLFIRTEKF